MNKTELWEEIESCLADEDDGAGYLFDTILTHRELLKESLQKSAPVGGDAVTGAFQFYADPESYEWELDYDGNPTTLVIDDAGERATAALEAAPKPVTHEPVTQAGDLAIKQMQEMSQEIHVAPEIPGVRGPRPYIKLPDAKKIDDDIRSRLEIMNGDSDESIKKVMLNMWRRMDEIQGAEAANLLTAEEGD